MPLIQLLVTLIPRPFHCQGFDCLIVGRPGNEARCLYLYHSTNLFTIISNQTNCGQTIIQYKFIKFEVGLSGIFLMSSLKGVVSTCDPRIAYECRRALSLWSLRRISMTQFLHTICGISKFTDLQVTYPTAPQVKPNISVQLCRNITACVVVVDNYTCLAQNPAHSSLYILMFWA